MEPIIDEKPDRVKELIGVIENIGRSIEKFQQLGLKDLELGDKKAKKIEKIKKEFQQVEKKGIMIHEKSQGFDKESKEIEQSINFYNISNNSKLEIKIGI